MRDSGHRDRSRENPSPRPGVLTYGFAAPPALGGNAVVIGGMDRTLYAFPVD
jgi:hypothetical protein